MIYLSENLPQAGFEPARPPATLQSATPQTLCHVPL